VINKKSSTPLYSQIETMLLEQIRAGKYPPSTQVPSEIELSEKYEISRMTARKALDHLVSQGLLYRRKGKGTYVAENVMSYGLSTMLSFSRTFQASGHKVKTKVLQQKVVKASLEITEKLRLTEGSEVVFLERLRFVDGKPAAIHSAWLEQRQFAALETLDLTTLSLLDAVERVSGFKVIATQDSVQASLADKGSAKLLGIKAGSPVLHVEGVAYNVNREAIRYTKAVYRGDMFKLMVMNSSEKATPPQLSSVFFTAQAQPRSSGVRG
jgi:GntR family transcriptional regulator